MNQHSRLTSGKEAEQKQKLQEQAEQTVHQERVFETAEELIRADAAQTEGPARVAERLGKSLEGLPKRPTSWWRRLLGSS